MSFFGRTLLSQTLLYSAYPLALILSGMTLHQLVGDGFDMPVWLESVVRRDRREGFVHERRQIPTQNGIEFI